MINSCDVLKIVISVRGEGPLRLLAPGAEKLRHCFPYIILHKEFRNAYYTQNIIRLNTLRVGRLLEEKCLLHLLLLSLLLVLTTLLSCFYLIRLLRGTPKLLYNE